MATARATFQQLIQQDPGDAQYQLGLANACTIQFEASRTDLEPNAEALRLADSHARQACRLAQDLAEARDTLRVVRERTCRRADALACARRDGRGRGATSLPLAAETSTGGPSKT